MNKDKGYKHYLDILRKIHSLLERSDDRHEEGTDYRTYVPDKGDLYLLEDFFGLPRNELLWKRVDELMDVADAGAKFYVERGLKVEDLLLVLPHEDGQLFGVDLIAIRTEPGIMKIHRAPLYDRMDKAQVRTIEECIKYGIGGFR